MATDAPESPLRLEDVEESYAGDNGGGGDMAFVPTDAPDVDAEPPASDPPNLNLIEEEDLVKKALASIQAYHTRYTSDRGDLGSHRGCPRASGGGGSDHVSR